MQVTIPAITAQAIDPGALHGAGRASAMRQRSIVVAIALSLLLHALGFCYLMPRAPMPTAIPRGDDSRLSIALPPLPPPAAQAPAAAATPAAAGPAQQPAPRRPVRPALAIKAAPAIVPRTSSTLPDAVQHVPAAADDMLTQLDAARRRRADAAAPEITAAPEDDAQRANRIARENIAAAHPGARGADKDDQGGVFQVRRLGLHSAEFMFRGWNVDFRRNSTQLVNVEQGADQDIRIAVVQKMIELIRRHKSGDFVWDSHRLGQQFTLSAKPEHGGELQQFLLREFFPDYVAATPR